MRSFTGRGLLTTAAVVLATVAGGARTPEAHGEAAPVSVALVWHMHQPRYPIVDGAVSRPWVAAHATKDYLDMATRAAASGVPVTFNLTPSLLVQLEESANGTVDTYRRHAAIPADQLTTAQADFIRARFFDTNSKIIDRFARYRELAAKDRAALTTDDLRDLQVLWPLSWFDPTFLAADPLKALVTKGRGFTEADKQVVFGEQQRIVAQVIPTYARLWKQGKIEVTTTPLAHPILPLIVDSDLFRASDPQGVAPSERIREYADAEQQVERGLDVAERLLGRRPTGMWPGEGAVAQETVKIYADAGVQWIASGEDVLARSLGIGTFARDASDTVLRADDLYRPYGVQHRAGQPTVGIVFRDTRLSDMIGFEYSGRPAAEAADDLIARLQRARQQLGTASGPHLVTIVLDGENAWENYADDGNEFLDALYQRLGHTDGIVATTPSAFLAAHPDAVRPLQHLAAGSWIGGTLTTWIGEPEEASAWDALRTTRLALRRAEQQGSATAAQLATATDAMLWAEGSDWFWWYGTDQDSGDDAYFDAAYRELLGQVYDAIGRRRPEWLRVPLVSTPALVAGEDGRLEGDAGAVGLAVGTAGVRVSAPNGTDVYLGAPRSPRRGRGLTLDGRVLGFTATNLVRIAADGTACLAALPPVGDDPTDPSTAVDCAALADGLVPLAALGGLQQGDRLLVRAVTPTAMTPSAQPGAVVAPDVGGVTAIVTLSDPAGDDHGPGATTYPTDTVFVPGSFDLTGFQWGVSGDQAVFTFDVAAPIVNPWNSPVGLSLQTFDVYVDADAATESGTPTGSVDLLGGRGAHLADGHGWDAALTIEGWGSKVVRATAAGPVTEHPTIAVSVVGERGRVVARVPLAALGLSGDPATWAVGVAVLSQDGYPSPGVDRVRYVATTAQQWKLGGGAATRIVDALDPEQGHQETQLGASPPVISVFAG